MRVILNGASGRMGQNVLSAIASGFSGSELAAAVDPVRPASPCDKYFPDLASFTGGADVIVDFSNHADTKALTEYALSRSLPLVIATTGHTDEELGLIRTASGLIPVFLSANMSVGVALLTALAKKAAEVLPDADIEIIETHHNRKQDAPSGTALMIANEIRKVRDKAFFTFGRHGTAPRQKDEIGIHAVRVGNIVGKHEVIIGTDAQTLTLTHEAQTRAVFAEGALSAAAFLVGREAGLYDMTDIVGGL